MAQRTIATLQTLRDEAKFDLFWERLLAQQSSLDVDAPELPQRREQPRRFELGIAKAEFCEDVKAMYRQQYYEALTSLSVLSLLSLISLDSKCIAICTSFY